MSRSNTTDPKIFKEKLYKRQADRSFEQWMSMFCDESSREMIEKLADLYFPDLRSAVEHLQQSGVMEPEVPGHKDASSRVWETLREVGVGRGRPIDDDEEGN